MLRLILSLILLTGVVGAVQANDTSMVAIGGSAVPMQNEHPQIRMVSETVHLDLYKGDYATSVDFLFANDGPANTVPMGFPERGIGVEKSDGKGLIRDFKTSVDGKWVTAKRTMTAPDNNSYQAYWCKTVTFGNHQQRHIHVQFRSPYGVGIKGTSAAYDFTGGNWHGKVTKSLLLVTSHSGAPNLAFAKLDGHLLTAASARREFVWHDWKAEGKFDLSEKN